MSAVDTWLTPLRPALPELTAADWRQLADLDARLDQLTPGEPAPDAGQVARSAWLLDVRRHLGAAGHTRPDRHPLTQTLAQFVCGFHDLDLRDATGLGHGALLSAATEPTRNRWLGLLTKGHLVGIAATERHGGSRIRETTTRAVPVGKNRWEISGEKVWVSRLVEASGIVVFFRDPDAHLSAAITDANTHGLHREPIPPAGLAGWTWGILRLRQVPSTRAPT
jgi:alkylation response protein AidB-like acyl-CoA dehydrogenase